MKTIVHKADTRGHADHGWLHANHSFSFANYHDESRIHFGMLRVLNDDTVAAGMGFGMHPHDNMEIVTIPLSGALEHKDSMGSHGIIKAGDVQIMSAGTGVFHSEFNASKSEEVKLFQVWVFPNKKNVQPRYDQKTFDSKDRVNKFQTIVSPEKNNGALWLHQEVWFSLADISAGNELNYSINRTGNGVYLMLIEGEAEVAGEKLTKRDAIGISEAKDFSISALTDSKVLVIDVPMN